MSIQEGCRHFLLMNCANAVVEMLNHLPRKDLEEMPPSYSVIREMEFANTEEDHFFALSTSRPSTALAELPPNSWEEVLRIELHSDSENLGFLFWCVLQPAMWNENTQASEATQASEFIVIIAKLRGYEPLLFRYTLACEFIGRGEVGEYLPMLETDFEKPLEIQ